MTVPKKPRPKSTIAPKQRGADDPRPLLANGGRRGKLRPDGTVAAAAEKWQRADYERAIREAHGVMSDAAIILGCSRAYIYQAVSHRFPDLWATIEEERGAIAEQALLAVQRFAFDPENPDLHACKEILK
ncbi:MAG: hypothetical protein NVS3B10_00290 [Polyangiales bacterium]